MVAHISSSGLRTLIDLGAVTLVMLPLIYGALSLSAHPTYRTSIILITPAIGLLYLRVLVHIPELHWLALGICALAWLTFLFHALSADSKKG